MAMWFTAGIFDQKWGHLFYRFSWSNSVCSVTALWNGGGGQKGRKCPRDLVLALLSSSICESWSEIALIQRKIKTCQWALLFCSLSTLCKACSCYFGVEEESKVLKNVLPVWDYKDQRETLFLNFHPLLMSWSTTWGYLK